MRTSYLIVLLFLAGLSHVPGIMVMGFFLLFVPGFILLASNTLVAYAGAAALAIELEDDFKISRYMLIGIVLAAVSVVPTLVGRTLVHLFSTQQMAGDFSIPSSLRPRSFLLPMKWGGWQRPANSLHPHWPDAHEARPHCGELCQSLLFNNLASEVFVTIAEDVRRDENKRVVPVVRHWRFRIDSSISCPELHSRIEKSFQPLIERGDCLVEELVDSPNADVAFEEVKHYRSSKYFAKLKRDQELRDKRRKRPNRDNANDTSGKENETVQDMEIPAPSDFSRFSLWMLKKPVAKLDVFERVGEDLKHKERRTEIVALVAPLPFFVGTNNTGNLGDWLPQIATWQNTVQENDAREVLSRRYEIVVPQRTTDSKL